MSIPLMHFDFLQTYIHIIHIRPHIVNDILRYILLPYSVEPISFLPMLSFCHVATQYVETFSSL